jgi:hypothetical protein
MCPASHFIPFWDTKYDTQHTFQSIKPTVRYFTSTWIGVEPTRSTFVLNTCPHIDGTRTHILQLVQSGFDKVGFVLVSMSPQIWCHQSATPYSRTQVREPTHLTYSIVLPLGRLPLVKVGCCLFRWTYRSKRVSVDNSNPFQLPCDNLSVIVCPNTH